MPASSDVQAITSSSMARPRFSALIRKRAFFVSGSIRIEISTRRRSSGYGFFPRLGSPVARALIVFVMGFARFVDCSPISWVPGTILHL